MPSPKKKRSITAEGATLRLAELCSKSEQCTHDLLEKMKRWGVSPDDSEQIITFLNENNYLSDKRFATAYARDKVRFSSWGKNKIRLGLINKRIPQPLITDALSDIEPDEYKKAILRCAKAKARTLNLSETEERRKLYRHLLSRGFESELISRLMSKLRLPGSRS